MAAQPEALAGLRLAGQRSSASGAQDFAQCPYRHLLKRGLRLYRWEEPERAYQIEGKDFGTLYHAVAYRLFAGLAERGELPLREDELDTLHDRIRVQVDEELAAFAAGGGIVNPALLEPVRVRMRSDLEEMLRDEIEVAGAEDPFVPVAFERGFEGLGVPLPGGESVTFRGKIDRVDEAGGARIRVIDYKTGKYVWGKEEQFKGGRELQLALYNRAARMLYPDREVTEAACYYATVTGEYQRKACPATPEVDETLTSVLATLDGLALAGAFPPVADSCRFCDFQTLCGPFRESRAERKSADPRLAAFKRLREIP